MEMDEKLLERFIKVEMVLDSVLAQQKELKQDFSNMKEKFASKEDIKYLNLFMNGFIAIVVSAVMYAVLNQVLK